MSTRNLRGAYFNPEHDRPQDWDFLQAWQPNVIRLMVHGSHSDPNSVDVNRIKRVHDACPDATILLRCWDVDDRNFEAHDAMARDPEREAAAQLDWWATLFDRVQDVPRHQLMAGLNNETGPEKDAPLYRYTERALQLGTQRAVRLGVFVFSVGRPSLPGEADYTIATFEQLDAAIVANHGARILHEYMQPEGMYAVWTDAQGNERKDWTYLMGRNTRWSGKSDIIIGEWGLDGILYNRHPDPTYGNSGWRDFQALWPPRRYADEYVECIRQASGNVIGVCPFISDWSDHKWQSFDMIDAYAALLERKDLCVKADATPPFTTHIPQVGTGAPTQPPVPPPSVVATGIIEPRVAQAILSIESGGRAFGNAGRPMIRFEAHIFKSRLGNDALWADHFRTDAARPWVDQMWRPSAGDPWRQIHTGKQDDEYNAFFFARNLNADAAYNSISVGAAQIMGFNHARIGYPSAQAMFDAFQSEPMQILAFVNYMLSDRGDANRSPLIESVRNRDWRAIASGYNGAGNVDQYATLLEQAYDRLGT